MSTDTTTTTRKKPVCPCCNGHGMHELRVYVGGRSPDDEDAECSLCGGSGLSWFDGRRNSCAGWRSLHRTSRGYV
jgi:hypothetical protein